MNPAVSAASGVEVRRVTAGHSGHFFGYYDMPAWDASGRWLLAQRVELDAAIPTAADPAVIGVIDLHDRCRFHPVAQTHAWSWQQGALLHWLPLHGPRTIAFNDVDAGRFAARVMDVDTGASRVLDRPIAAVSHDQRTALSLNFARLRVRPEVGYPGVADPWAGVDHPDEDGIYVIDLASGAAELAVSLHAIAGVRPDASMDGALNWVNHLIYSPDDTQVMFVHRWRPAGARRFRTRFMRLRLADGALHEIWPARVSHMCWRSPGEILFSGSPADAPDDPLDAPGPLRFWLLDLASTRARPVGGGALPADGHCSYRPGGRFVLMDTAPDAAGLRTLLVYDEQTERALELGRFHAPARYRGPVRCDLHPRWSRDGAQVCFDSVHEGSRQMYTAHVEPALRAWAGEG